MKERDEEEFLASLIKSWNETRALTHDLINEGPVDKFNEKISRPGLDTIAKQILELSSVQMAYVNVLHGEPLNFSEVEGITFGKQDYIAKSRQELSELLDGAEKQFRAVLRKRKNWRENVRLFGEDVPSYYVIDLMTRHETLHQGQLIIFCYILGIKFPDSWVDTWALPQKK